LRASSSNGSEISIVVFMPCHPYGYNNMGTHMDVNPGQPYPLRAGRKRLLHKSPADTSDTRTPTGKISVNVSVQR